MLGPMPSLQPINGYILPSVDGSRAQMTEGQFREWLKSIDRDNDGRISRRELKDALKGLGMHRTNWKSWWAMHHADINSDHFIDGDLEVEELIKYAKKKWIIVT